MQDGGALQNHIRRRTRWEQTPVVTTQTDYKTTLADVWESEHDPFATKTKTIELGISIYWKIPEKDGSANRHNDMQK